MITREYRIYDTGPMYAQYLVEVPEGASPPLVPRYKVHRWVYKNGELVDSPGDGYRQEYYLDDVWHDDEVFNVCDRLNEEWFGRYDPNNHEAEPQPTLNRKWPCTSCGVELEADVPKWFGDIKVNCPSCGQLHYASAWTVEVPLAAEVLRRRGMR